MTINTHNSKLQAHLPTAENPYAVPEPRCLMVHVPKTGGTSLDSFLRDHYHGQKQASHIQYSMEAKYFEQINDLSNIYVSGHFPAPAADLRYFARKITIIRKPLSVLSSMLNFINMIGSANPGLNLAEKLGRKYEIYASHFARSFDIIRFLYEGPMDIQAPFETYVSKPNLEESLSCLNQFTHVLDFDNLDAEIKSLTIKFDMFPCARSPRKRSYSYKPDYSRAQSLLSEFDEQFYEGAKSRFNGYLDNIDTQYERYQESYCKKHGHFLSEHEERLVNLYNPMGSGWHAPETNVNGKPFRWSDDARPTIEIPIAAAGLYAIYIYFTRDLSAGLNLKFTTLINPQQCEHTYFAQGELKVFKSVILLESHDWININLDIAFSEESQKNTANLDSRTLGVVLSQVYIKRIPL